MKIERVILKELGFVAAGTVFCSAVMQVVFLLCRSWWLGALWGAILTGGVGILNFFLLGLTVQKMVASGDEAQAKAIFRLSKTGRLLLLGAALAIGCLVDSISTVAAVAAIFFPRLTLMLRQILLKRGMQAAMAAGALLTEGNGEVLPENAEEPEYTEGGDELDGGTEQAEGGEAEA